jgi:hypothetical protein
VSKMREAEHEVIAAAECVSHTYRAYAGYTVPLSTNLRRLDAAVRAWQALVNERALGSDTNGFDRSALWGEEGHSNQQTSPGAQRRQGCAAASRVKP